jgi:anthranilate phosphoribosyltransferase
VLQELTKQLAMARHLTETQVPRAVADLASETVPVAVKADFLAELARKGETAEEIAWFAAAMRDRAIQPAIGPELRAGELLDVVGTGGDRLSTFNISTATALLASAAGVNVVKHGNRASTSPIGSADVMEALGIPFDLGPEEAVAALRRHGFAFFFAPKYHPAFRHIIPARKLCAARGQATIFNFLGPLLNPARPTAMLLGVPRSELCEPLARVLQTLGVRRAMVVCGCVPDASGGTRYLDELSPLGPSTVAGFGPGRPLQCSSFSPAELPLQSAQLADLRGGDRELNASIIRRVLGGDERGPKRDAVLLNSAAALVVANAAPDFASAWSMAAAVIDSGLARRKLNVLAAR